MEEEQIQQKGLMTQGTIWKQLLLFSVPLLLGNLFQLLYNTVDSIVVGNFIGGNALAAVGASNPIINLLVGLFTGIATGAGVVIARYYGAKDRQNVQDAVHTAIGLTLVAGVFLMVLGTAVSPLLLRLCGTPPEVMDGAVLYLRIYFLGILFMMLYNIGAGILRAAGDSKTPLYYLIVASIVNIILDPVLVVVVGMGIDGVAYATMIAQAISSFLILRRLMRTDQCYRLILGRLRIHRRLLWEIIRMGLPGGLQNAIISFSNVIVQVNINSFGAAAMAGCSSYIKIDGFAMLPIMSFAMAVTTFTGQNIGAGNHQRVRQGTKTCLIMSVSVVAALSAALLLFGQYILRIFSSEPEILYYANYMLRVLAPSYVCLAVAQTLAGVIRGAGAAMAPMIILVLNMCVLRVVWISLAMPLMQNILVVFLGYAGSWVTSALCMALYYKKGNWLRL